MGVNDTLDVIIPPRAKRVKISIPVPGLLLPVSFRMGQPGFPATVLEVRQAFFNAVTVADFRSTEEIQFPENAGHLHFPLDAFDARVVTITWLLEI